MPFSHFTGQNFWILKAINLNRGRGIHVFNNLTDLKSLIQYYTTKKANPSPQKQTLEAIYSQPQTLVSQSPPKIPKSHTSFIIQKYIEKPFLINGRKFDIRVWVLVSHTGK